MLLNLDHADQLYFLMTNSTKMKCMCIWKCLTLTDAHHHSEGILMGQDKTVNIISSQLSVRATEEKER